MKNLRDELDQLKYELYLAKKVYCDKEEVTKCEKLKKDKQILPDEIKVDDNGYFRYIESDLSKDEIDQLLLFRQLSYLSSIKCCMMFFVVLTIISIILSLLSISFR